MPINMHDAYIHEPLEPLCGRNFVTDEQGDSRRRIRIAFALNPWLFSLHPADLTSPSQDWRMDLLNKDELDICM